MIVVEVVTLLTCCDTVVAFDADVTVEIAADGEFPLFVALELVEIVVFNVTLVLLW